MSEFEDKANFEIEKIADEFQIPCEVLIGQIRQDNALVVVKENGEEELVLVGHEITDDHSIEKVEKLVNYENNENVEKVYNESTPLLSSFNEKIEHPPALIITRHTETPNDEDQDLILDLGTSPSVCT
eukprot:Pgem_evm1s4204